MMKKKMLLLVLLISSLLLSLYFGGVHAVHSYLSTSQQVHSSNDIEPVLIKRGLSGRSIISLLHKRGIIPYPRVFFLVWKLKYKEKPFKAGEYSFSVYDRPVDILERLIRGDVILHTLTIPEGWTIYDIETRILQRFKVNPQQLRTLLFDASLLVESGTKAQNLEGFLFPDTYHFPRDTDAEKIIGTMVRRFFQIFSDQHRKKAEQMGFSIMKTVTLASMIEKEAAIPEERPLISAVYHNRLKKGMRLQCDPTVIYALPDFDGNLTKKNLEYDSPYNTYRYSGLTPGPICNPGKGALEAALNPADVSYLYFVAKGDRSGHHVFSKTLRDHNQAVYQEQIVERRKRKNRVK